MLNYYIILLSNKHSSFFLFFLVKTLAHVLLSTFFVSKDLLLPPSRSNYGIFFSHACLYNLQVLVTFVLNFGAVF